MKIKAHFGDGRISHTYLVDMYIFEVWYLIFKKQRVFLTKWTTESFINIDRCSYSLVISFWDHVSISALLPSFSSLCTLSVTLFNTLHIHDLFFHLFSIIWNIKWGCGTVTEELSEQQNGRRKSTLWSRRWGKWKEKLQGIWVCVNMYFWMCQTSRGCALIFINVDWKLTWKESWK